MALLRLRLGNPARRSVARGARTEVGPFARRSFSPKPEQGELRMSTLYTGNAGNVSLGSAISTTIPADGDALTAASVNTALQKVDDYLAAFRQTVNPGILIWNSFLSGVASSTTYRLTTAYPGAVLAPTADTVGQTQIVAPTAGTIRNFEYRTSQTNPQNAASNSVVISLTI